MSRSNQSGLKNPALMRGTRLPVHRKLPAAKRPDRLQWWREARFGMFIHWGLYAIPAGIWKDQPIAGIGEWIMNRARIPVSEYGQLARQFHPTRFDADEWVRLARDAGMQYLVITAKHHDGFSMYDSACSDYDVVDATPWATDPMKPLAEACHRYGVKLCFYYSQAQDWHDPDAAGNNWDFPDEEKKDFARYLRDKVKPQLRELLTNYGPIGLIWFDTPRTITRAQSLDLKRFVHRLQPDCIVSGRVGHDVGDYGSMGDNEIPLGPLNGDWETPATLNDTWGFKIDDHNWKSTESLLRLLVDLASKGVNYLLNVGPTADGVIPKPSVQRLREMGQWLQRNGESIYGTQASPFPCEFNWGRITRKGRRMYLHFYDWPSTRAASGRFRLPGLRNRVRRATLLANGQRVDVAQHHDQGNDEHFIELELPRKAPDRYVSVLVLELDGEPDVVNLPLQQPDGTVLLPAFMGRISTETNGRADGRAVGRTDGQANGQAFIGRAGIVQGWRSTQTRLRWAFRITAPGSFRVDVQTIAPKYKPWEGGHEMAIRVAGQQVVGRLEMGQRIENPRTHYFEEVASPLGTIELKHSGQFDLEVKALHIREDLNTGAALSAVRLTPVT